MTDFPRTLAFALTLVILATPLSPPAEAEPARPVPVETPGGLLDELERQADELSETARRTIEEFVNLIGPMLIRLSRLVDGLPAYEAPEVLPNGDIIIRRKREPVPPREKGEDGLTET